MLAWLSSTRLSDPSPSPSYDDCAYRALVEASGKMLVSDVLGQEFSLDSSKVLCVRVEAGQFAEVAFSHTLAF